MFPLTIVLAMSCLLISCSKTNDAEKESAGASINKISVTITGNSALNNQIDEVQLVREKPATATPAWETIAKSPFNNGSFTIDLPAAITTTTDDVLDVSYQADIDETVVENTLKVSDSPTRVVFPYLFAYKASELVGTLLSAASSAGKDYAATYVYADKDATIKGKLVVKENATGYTATTLSDVTLKKGWNTLYASYAETGNNHEVNFSSTAPTVQLSWNLYDNPDDIFKSIYGSVTGKNLFSRHFSRLAR